MRRFIASWKLDDACQRFHTDIIHLLYVGTLLCSVASCFFLVSKSFTIERIITTVHCQKLSSLFSSQTLFNKGTDVQYYILLDVQYVWYVLIVLCIQLGLHFLNLGEVGTFFWADLLTWVCVSVCVGFRYSLHCGDINLLTQWFCGDLPPLWGQTASSLIINHQFWGEDLNVRWV